MKTHILFRIFSLTSLIIGTQLISGAANSDTTLLYRHTLTQRYSTLTETIKTNAGLPNEIETPIIRGFTTHDTGNRGPRFKIAICNQGQEFVSVHKEANVVQFWDAHTGELNGSTDTTLCTIDGPKKHTLNCGGTKTKFSQSDSVPLNPEYVAVSPCQKLVAAAGLHTGVKLFDLSRPDATGDAQSFCNTLGHNNQLAFTADNRRLISTSSAHTMINKTPKSAAFYIHAIRKGRIIKSTRMQHPYLAQRCICAHPLVNQFAVSSGSLITIHDKTGQELHALDCGPYENILSLKYSTDGRSLASGGSDYGVHLRDAEHGKHARKFSTTIRTVPALAIAPNGSLVFGVTRPGSDNNYLIHVWDTRSGQEIQTINSGQVGINTLDFNDRGNLISSTLNGVVKIWSNDPSMGAPVTIAIAEEHSDSDE